MRLCASDTSSIQCLELPDLALPGPFGFMSAKVQVRRCMSSNLIPSNQEFKCSLKQDSAAYCGMPWQAERSSFVWMISINLKVQWLFEQVQVRHENTRCIKNVKLKFYVKTERNYFFYESLKQKLLKDCNISLKKNCSIIKKKQFDESHVWYGQINKTQIKTSGSWGWALIGSLPN